ncbi:MAG: taurine dioxygenase [Gammaproteobacteria bacterium]|jgi:taurine dioxygenase|nr:taurine dioxygenase [Gammaproteobacteria bacterium]
MTLSVTRLSPSIGALVEGVQIGELLTAAASDEIGRALIEHQVLFFRDQTITPAQHRDFASQFGKLHIHPIYPAHPDAPEIIVLDTDVVDLTDNAIWHTDVTFSQTPPLGGILIARVLPPYGGDTLWSSSGAAFDALSAPMQAFLQGLTATHNIAQSFPTERFALTPEAQERLDSAKRNNPPVSHPVIRTHPVSGRKGLFVQDGFTTHINELSAPESRALLTFLYAHSVKPEFAVRWRWRVGDVAFWDNRATQHYAVDDYRPARRVMNRATIIGDRPV